MRGSSYIRWGARAAIALSALVVTANLATGVAFSETAVQARVARAVSQLSTHFADDGAVSPLGVVVASSRGH